MRIISLWQPWASLWVLGYKIHETRHFQTSHRGPLLVHAAKRWTREQRELIHEEPFRTCLKDHVSDSLLEPLPLGAIVGVVNLTAVIPVERVVASDVDRAFGDYSPKRFAWFALEAWKLSTPYEFRGQQGMWQVSDDHLEAIRPLLVRTRRAAELRPVEAQP